MSFKDVCRFGLSYKYWLAPLWIYYLSPSVHQIPEFLRLALKVLSLDFYSKGTRVNSSRPCISLEVHSPQTRHKLSLSLNLTIASTASPTHPLPTKKIALIIGSTRALRIGPSVAAFIKTILDSAPSPSSSPKFDTSLTVLDLATFNLPVFDEPVLPASVPAYAQFTHQHSIAWSAEIAKYDGYVIVSAEYNYGIPGALKNAIDYLYHACTNKPVLLITYGIFGGKFASENLKQSLEGMHMSVCGKRVMLEYPGRDAERRNMSPSLMSAMGGC